MPVPTSGTGNGLSNSENGAPSFAWRRWPETEAFLKDRLAEALAGNAFAERLAARMAAETSTRFGDWIDHLVLERSSTLATELTRLGYEPMAARYDGANAPAFEHRGGLFPRLALAAGPGGPVREVAIKVDSAADFSRAHDLGLEPSGYPAGPFRAIRVPGEKTSFAAVERRAYTGFEPMPGELARIGRLTPHAARDALGAFDLWHGRKRRFDEDEQGFYHMDALLERVIERAGDRDLACHLVFEAERRYWQSRNTAATIQKARQDRLGLGWANHDHHTFRSSRRFFPRLVAILKRLGFYLREHFHAGEHAGWGAQVLEQPVCGLVVFADLDLAPEEASSDFSHLVLPELPRPNTVGLWVGLHGESILEAGMHHLEAQFDFEALRRDLEHEAKIPTMPPFSDFPFLRQAFTQGERWSVQPHRVGRLLEMGWIDASQHERFLLEGAIGSHLENLQRAEGYKGFNQQAVSAIIAATDPRLNASERNVATVSSP